MPRRVLGQKVLERRGTRTGGKRIILRFLTGSNAIGMAAEPGHPLWGRGYPLNPATQLRCSPKGALCIQPPRSLGQDGRLQNTSCDADTEEGTVPTPGAHSSFNKPESDRGRGERSDGGASTWSNHMRSWGSAWPSGKDRKGFPSSNRDFPNGDFPLL